MMSNLIESLVHNEIFVARNSSISISEINRMECLEFNMMVSVLHEQLEELFDQQNSDEEPHGMIV